MYMVQERALLMMWVWLSKSGTTNRLTLAAPMQQLWQQTTYPPNLDAHVDVQSHHLLDLHRAISDLRPLQNFSLVLLSNRRCRGPFAHRQNDTTHEDRVHHRTINVHQQVHELARWSQK